ncbi:hypothetical protein QJS04_geneDACA014202 [Acorus gramineus]|uniref:peptidylprolyl isomerase n=1 Tax=Acorus gramineus TaxID=55184 RepID=A0AAV9B6L5_ACOGR|nr:hypothetical protein QJS04_geneDACA014202 [Acorus gramineus]
MLVVFENCISFIDCLITRIILVETNNFLSQVAANYVALVSNGQILDSSLEKGVPYLFRVGSGQVIEGLDEGILSMKTGGKRRLYIPGSLGFPKGLTSALGRLRVAPNSPVIFDVSLEYIPRA